MSIGKAKSRFLLTLSAAVAFVAMTSCDRVDFDAAVARPAFDGDGPTLLFDEGHHNHHTLASTYAPFAKLLRNDGFEVARLAGPASRDALAKARILAIVTAEADTETNDGPAFTPNEVAAIVAWVRNGGSLLLVTDHYPFPNAAEGLATAFGLDVAKGMTFDPANYRRESGDESQIIYSRANRLLSHHPVTDGRNTAERVSLVETFTGDAFRARNETVQPLLRLAPTAVNRLGRPVVSHDGGNTLVSVQFGDPKSASGWMQGAAIEFGKGRVIALADAAMITAQENGGKKIGMNAPGNDNRRFLLNAMHWLAHVD